jgi:hypothetical protein
MKLFKNTIVVIAIICLSCIGINGQTIEFRKQVENHNFEKLNANDSLHFGFVGEYGGHVITGLLINNKGQDSLSISNISNNNINSKIQIFAEEEYKIAPKDSVYISVFCQRSNDLSYDSNFLEFTTNDPQNPNFKLLIDANNGKGLFNINYLSNLVSNDSIDLGNIELGDKKDFSLKISNNGEAYFLEKTSLFDLGENTLKQTSSVQKVYYPKVSETRSYSFEAKSLGNFSRTIAIPLENAQINSKKIYIKGEVVAPKLEVYNKSSIVNINDTIEWNNEYFKSQTYQLQLANSGKSDLNIADIKVISDCSSLLSLNKSKLSILAGEKANLELFFKPQKNEYYSANIVIESNSQLHKKFNLSLRIKMDLPQIEILDSEENNIEYYSTTKIGNSIDGASMNGYFYIKNSGTYPLRIDSLSKFEKISSSQILVKNIIDSTILPNQKIKVDLQYLGNKLKEETAKATINIYSNSFIRKHSSWDFEVDNLFSDIAIQASEGMNTSNNGWISLGDCPVGDSVKKTIKLKNNGTRNLNIQNIKITSSAFSIGDIQNRSIKPGEFETISIKFKPTKSGVHKHNFVIESDDFTQAIFKLNLEANTTRSELRLYSYNNELLLKDGDTLHLSDIDYGSKIESYFRLYNYGKDKLSIQNITNSTDSESKFEIHENEDIQLTDGQSKTINYTIEPSGFGKKTHQVKFNTNDFEHPSFNFFITYTCLASSMIVESSQQLQSGDTVICDKTLDILIRNNGNTQLEIENIYYEEFESRYLTPIHNVENSSYSFELKEHDSKLSDRVHIISNDPKNREFIFTVLYPKVVEVKTDIEEISGKSRLYPTVNRGNFKLYTNSAEQTVLNIYNMSGNKVFTQKINGNYHEIETHLNKGMYLVEVVSNGNRTLHKIVINK